MSNLSDGVTRSAVPNALAGVCLMPGAEFSVAVDNKGCWPNILLLPNGEILATFYNHPSHGFGYGDIELWVSRNGGQGWWEFRSQVSDHSDNVKSCRMNHAFGRTATGELVLLVSGWGERRRLPILPVQLCISSDQGRSWARRVLDELPVMVPFGKVVLSPDGRLTCGMYRGSVGCSVFTSDDHGRTWTFLSRLENGSEVALLRLRNGGRWLAAARHREDAQDAVDLYTSTDEARSWSAPLSAPLPGYPADLLELADGRILLVAEERRRDATGTYRAGLTAALSSDQGETWLPYRYLIFCPWDGDYGYPSSIQLWDGTVVTAYYWGGRAQEGQYEGGRTDLPHSRGLPWHARYHMGVVRWRPGNLLAPS